MESICSTKGSVFVAKLSGGIEANSIRSMQRISKEFESSGPHGGVVLDMEGVSFATSYLVNFLIQFCKAHGLGFSDVTIRNPNSQVFEVLDVARVASVFRVEPFPECEREQAVEECS